MKVLKLLEYWSNTFFEELVVEDISMIYVSKGCAGVRKAVRNLGMVKNLISKFSFYMKIFSIFFIFPMTKITILIVSITTF